MKSKVCSEEQTCGGNADRIRREMSSAVRTFEFLGYSAISAVDFYRVRTF